MRVMAKNTVPKHYRYQLFCVLSYADYSSINFCNSCREITTLKLELMTSRSKKSPHEGILLNK